MKKAFTTIELLVVMAIIGILGYMIYSVCFGKGPQPRTFERNGHTYFQTKEWNGKVFAWGTPVHDPDCPKCNTHKLEQ